MDASIEYKMLSMTLLLNQVLSIESQSPSETENLAHRLAKQCPSNAVVYLSGELGTGKSTFARAFLQSLGVTASIKSPTYTLMETYALENGLEAIHMDLYRIFDPDEINFLGLDSFASNVQVMLIEWPEKGMESLPAADLMIQLNHHGQNRRIALRASTDAGLAWLTSAQIGFLNAS
jgi:tRNA threonylcarbamoyladenosine biosynthesis protein TsaE